MYDENLLTVGFFAISDFGFEVAYLSIDVEPESSGALEFKNLATRAPVVLGTITDTVFELRITVKFAVSNALNSLYSSCLFVIRCRSAVVSGTCRTK